MRPHRQQPTRLPYPSDSPGKNTGVGCHFLLQCMKVKSESEVAQSCPTLSDPMDCSLPAPPSWGFSRQQYRSGVPLPSLALQVDSLPTELWGKPYTTSCMSFKRHCLTKRSHKQNYIHLLILSVLLKNSVIYSVTIVAWNNDWRKHEETLLDCWKWFHLDYGSSG